MSTVPVLQAIDDLTADWLATALGVPVPGFTAAKVGTGQLGDTHRIVLDGDGEVGSVILKLASPDPTVRATGVSLGQYSAEVAFYRDLAARLPGEALAACHVAAYDEAGGWFTLLLEDLGDMEVGDQLIGCTLDQARLAVLALARLQAPTVGDSSLEERLSKVQPATGGLLEMMLPHYYAKFGDRIAPAHRQVVERFLASFDLWKVERREPFGLTHDDYRLDNMLWAEPGATRELAVVDWATHGWGPVTSDLAYFIGGNLTTEERRAHEQELVRLYHDELVALGVSGWTFAQCWDSYRRLAFAGVLMAVGAPNVIEPTPRAEEMFMTMLARHCEQVLDLDSIALLDELDAAVIVLDPVDEQTHEPGLDTHWNESYYLDAISADGTLGAYVRIGLVPNLGKVVYTAYVVGEGRRSVGILDYAAPMPTSGLAIQTDLFSSDLVVEEPTQRVRVTLAGTGEQYDDPSAPLRGEAGDPVEVELDLVWATEGTPYRYRVTTRYELPCRVTGTIRVGHEVFTFDGPGQRDHSWGPRDWWAMDWTWASAHLDDGTRLQGIELRFPGLPPAGVGYEQDAQGLVELDAMPNSYEIDADRLVRQTSVALSPSDTRLEYEPIAFGALRIEAEDGRVCEFPRAMARITTPDGRTGLGWIEWGHNLRPVVSQSRARRALKAATAAAAERATALVNRVPDARLERLMGTAIGPTVVRAMFRELPRRINPAAAEGIEAVVRWQVSDPGSGRVDRFDLVLPGKGKPFVRRPEAGDGIRPRVTVTLSAAEMLALGLARTDPFTSYARRRILFEGDASFMATVASLLSSSAR